MKILIINHRFFNSGGPEQYMFNITQLLEEKGHEVAHFSFKHSRNRHSPYERFFPEHPYSSESVYFNETKSGKLKRLRQAIKLVYNRKADSKLCSLIKHFEPDIAYILQAVNYMSFIDINEYEPCYDHRPHILYVGNNRRYKKKFELISIL